MSNSPIEWYGHLCPYVLTHTYVNSPIDICINQTNTSILYTILYAILYILYILYVYE